MRLIIDAHLDLAWNALSWKRDITLSLDELNRRDIGRDGLMARGRATVSLPEMRRGGVAVCLATLMARVPHGESMVHAEMLDYPSRDIAHGVARGQLAYYRALERRGEIRILTSRSKLDTHWQRWTAADVAQRHALPVGIILAMEGCDAITSPSEAELWWDLGLRCPALVHYGAGAYAMGTGAEGGITTDGHKLLDEFSRLGMILDTTHLSDESFVDAVSCFNGPIMASHQNCRALVPGVRQFTDTQVKAVIDRGGILGAPFDAWMMHPGWVRGFTVAETTSRDLVSLDVSADHMDHIRGLAGNCQHSAIGSDLDGGFGTEQTPRELDRISDLQLLDEILQQRGYTGEDIDEIFHGNWLRFFREHLPES